MARRILSTAVAVSFLACLPASAGLWDSLQQVLGGLGGVAGTPAGAGLSPEEVAAGLREALRVGAERAVDKASRAGGFWEDPAIRIPLPERLRTGANLLRTLGMGPRVDAFEETLNRAAEKAAAQALPIFGEAVAAMTFEDVERIWRGGDTAATEYLRRTTEARLFAAFRPVGHDAAREVGVTRAYQSLTARPEISTLVAGSDLDLDDYTTTKALDGLFFLLGAEEKRIRTDPVARTTDLLSKVFAHP